MKWFSQLLEALKAIAAALVSIDRTMRYLARMPLIDTPVTEPTEETEPPPIDSATIRELRARVEFAKDILPSTNPDQLLDQLIRELQQPAAQNDAQTASPSTPEIFSTVDVNELPPEAGGFPRL